MINEIKIKFIRTKERHLVNPSRNGKSARFAKILLQKDLFKSRRL